MTHSALSELESVGNAPDSMTHTVIFAVNQLNSDRIQYLLEDVSNPSSKNYGKYLTRDEVGEITSNIESSLLVEKFLILNDVRIVWKSTYGEYIRASANVSTWNSLLQTNFQQFIVPRNKYNSFIRAQKIVIPVEIVDHIVSVMNTVQYPHSSSRRFKRIKNDVSIVGDSIYDSYVYPGFMNSYYNIQTNTGYIKATQALFAARSQIFSPPDLAYFQSIFNIPNNPIDHYKGGGAVNNTACFNLNNLNLCSESNFDAQYLTSLAQVCNTTYWYAIVYTYILDKTDI